MAEDPIIQLEHVDFSYGAERRVLSDLNLTLDRGEKMALTGPNGSGKTTLLHVIVGLLKPRSGRVRIFGKPRIEERDFFEVRAKIGLLFQDPDDQLFCSTVAEDVAFGPFNLGRPRAEVVATVKRMLAFLGLEGFEDRITYRLSAGEKRLVSLATVLAMEPETLLLDEPSNGLDDSARERLIRILNTLKQSFLLVSHDQDLIRRTCSTEFNLQSRRKR